MGYSMGGVVAAALADRARAGGKELMAVVLVNAMAPGSLARDASRRRVELWLGEAEGLYDTLDMAAAGLSRERFLEVLRRDIAAIARCHRGSFPRLDRPACIGTVATPQVALEHGIYEDRGTAVLYWDAAEEAFHPGLLDDMFRAHELLIRGLAADERTWNAPGADLYRSVMPAGEREPVAAIDEPAGPMASQLLHTAPLRHLASNPEHPAVITSEQTLSYREIFARAHRLGHRLRALGARPNHLVAVVLGRGPEQVAAVLGILAAGAAYVPIDPHLPPQRRDHLLGVAAAALVVTSSALAARSGWPAHLELVPIDDDEYLAESPVTPPEPAQQPTDLAYVIFTSGSTGRPRGVEITASGKLDPRALPAAVAGELGPARPTSQPPRNRIEAILASLWAELLDLPVADIGIHDRFFDLGGNSILLISMVGKINARLRVSISLSELLRYPTVHDLARHIASMVESMTSRAVDAGRRRAGLRKRAMRRARPVRRR